jgi:hypothetical protein
LQAANGYSNLHGYRNVEVAMDAFSVIAICAVVLSIVVARVWLVITSFDDMITHSHP